MDDFVPAPMRRQGKMIAMLQFVSVVLIAFGLLWFSPAFVHYVKRWTRLYSVCVAEAPPAETLGRVLATRTRCARLATNAVR